MRQSAKRVLDTHFPAVSRVYRHFRDYVNFKNLKPYKTIFGFQLYGDAHLDTSRSESFEIDTFTNYAKKSDVVVDIGANVGLFTCLAAQAGRKVLAIEPHPYNLQCLYRNIEINHFNDVEIYPVALSDHVSILPLYGGGQGATLLREWSGIQSNYHKLIPVNTLDNLISDRFNKQRLLIKVDVEGNEFHLLRGATVLLAMSPAPFWIIENGLSENFNDHVNPYFEQVFDLFWEQKYEAYTIGQDTQLIKPDDVRRWIRNKKNENGGINYLFLRNL